MINKNLIWIIVTVLLLGSINVNAYVTNIMDIYNKELVTELEYYNYDNDIATLALVIPPGNYSVATHKIILREDYRDVTENKPWYSKLFYGIGAEIAEFLHLPQETICWNVIPPYAPSVDVLPWYLRWLLPYRIDNFECIIVEVVTRHPQNSSDFKQTVHSELIHQSPPDGLRHNCHWTRDSDSIEVTTYYVINGSLGNDAFCRIEFVYPAWDVTENLDYLLNVKKETDYIRSFNSLLLNFVKIVQSVIAMIIEMWGIAYWIFKLLVVTFVIGLVIYIFVLVYQIFKNLMES